MALACWETSSISRAGVAQTCSGTGPGTPVMASASAWASQAVSGRWRWREAPATLRP